MKKQTVWMTAVAIIFGAVPAFAQAQQSSSTSGTDQSAQTEQATGTAQAGQTQQTTPPPQTIPPQQTTAPQQTTPPQQTATQDKDKKDDKKDDPDNPKNDRLFMVVANYATVEHPKVITPLTAKEKFKIGAEDAFDTYSIPLAAVLAAIAQAKNDDASWGQGWLPYGKRLAAGYGDTVIGSFMTTGVFPSMLHEDPRYFRLGTGTKRARSWYALKRILVIRNDRGGNEFNFSEFGGNATAAAISLTYHSRADLNFSSWAGDYGTQIAIDVIANQCKEFWPDIRKKVLHK
jgi:hypothetical protein